MVDDAEGTEGVGVVAFGNSLADLGGTGPLIGRCCNLRRYNNDTEFHSIRLCGFQVS
jgi:hypothetical protein